MLKNLVFKLTSPSKSDELRRYWMFFTFFIAIIGDEKKGKNSCWISCLWLKYKWLQWVLVFLYSLLITCNYRKIYTIVIIIKICLFYYMYKCTWRYFHRGKTEGRVYKSKAVCLCLAIDHGRREGFIALTGIVIALTGIVTAA